MVPDLLSDIELYYSPTAQENSSIILEGEEFKHSVNVMRHSTGDFIFVTDGKGRIFEVTVKKVERTKLVGEIKDVKKFKNKFSNVFFVLPRLKSSNRFETALEKAIELGVNNFVVYNAKRSVAKGAKLERWRKIALSAMKQSLLPFLPQINFIPSLSELNCSKRDKIFIFEQKADLKFTRVLSSVENNPDVNFYFIFGPEGGLTDEEQNFFPTARKVSLTENRLRSETAIITVAVLIANFFN